jgi:hypothetical protein
VIKIIEMKKIPLNYLHDSRLLIAAAVIILLLESCCLHPRYLEGAKRPCNCKNDPELVKNKPLPVPVSNQGVLTDKPQQSVPADAKKEVLQPVQNSTAVYTNSVLQEKKMEDLLLPRKISISEKKLPLGIKGISTSIIAGPTISFKSSKEDYGNTDHKHSPGAGIVLGIGTTYYFSEKFAVSTSLLFKQNNASEKLSYTIPGDPGGPGGGSTETETKYNYSYLSAPVLAQIKLSDQLTAVAGPEINYLLGASTKQSGNGEKNKITDNSVKVGAGAQVGLRYEIPNSPIGIQLLYDQRLSRLNKKNETTDYYPGGGGGGYEIPAWNMKSIQLGVTCALCELMKKK